MHKGRGVFRKLRLNLFHQRAHGHAVLPRATLQEVHIHVQALACGGDFGGGCPRDDPELALRAGPGSLDDEQIADKGLVGEERGQVRRAEERRKDLRVGW